MPDRSKPSQSISGKAWEYGLARSFARHMGIPLEENNPSRYGRHSYEQVDEQEQTAISVAADKAASFLINHGKIVSQCPMHIIMQGDKRGCEGDVRDLIIETAGHAIGISAKNRHADIKHPRIARKIDWPKEWMGVNATSSYWNDIDPIFTMLATSKFKKWSNLPDKETNVYMPLLSAFKKELERQHEKRPACIAENFMKYMIGRDDFYKIAKNNDQVSVQSFNMDGSLHWGEKVAWPDKIVNIEMRQGSKTTLEIIFRQGWALKLRLHNAEGVLTPSLKFAVGLYGQPTTLANHLISYT